MYNIPVQVFDMPAGPNGLGTFMVKAINATGTNRYQIRSLDFTYPSGTV